MCGPVRRACSFLHKLCPTEILDGVFSEAYKRAIMGIILVIKVIDCAEPLPMYSATIYALSYDQTKVAEGLLLEEWPSPHCEWVSCDGPRAYL